MGWKLKAVQSVISCWEAETWTLQWWVILIQSGSARHCRPPHLSDSSLSPSPYLPPSWALVPGWQLLMGRRRVVFIIMPLFIHVSVASDSRVYASLYFLPASSEMSHIHHPLSLSFSHSLSVLSSSQVLLLLSFKKKKKKALKNTEDSSVKSDGLCQHCEDRVKNISFLHWNCSARTADRQLSSYRRKSARLLTATFMRQPLACYFCSINSRLQFCEVDKPVIGDLAIRLQRGF